MAVDKSAKRAFPGASKTQWREDVGKTLRGQTDDGVSWTTSDGVEIDSLHVRGDIDALPHLTSGAVGILHHPRARAIDHVEHSVDSGSGCR